MHTRAIAARGMWVACCAGMMAVNALTSLPGCLPDSLNGDSASEQVLGYNPGTPGEPSSETPSSLFYDSQVNADWDEIISFDPDAPLTHTEVEPNDTWEQAEPLPFRGQVALIGTMAAGTLDVDLFEIGPIRAGQRMQAELVNNGADIQFGMLDEFGRIIAYLDPISPTAGPGRVDVVLHESSERLYLLVATRSSSLVERPYRAVIRLSSTLQPPRHRPQAVVLVFGGAGQVRIGSRPAVDVPPFDIGNVNPDFAGLTESAIELLMQNVREDFAGLNVTFYRDDDPDRPADDFTSIYFGTSDARLLGLADNIDPYNSNTRQSAILYTDTFSLFNQLRPGFSSTVRVLSNVTCHEVGHLLGLRHTADPEDMMDVTGSARQMLAEQYFKAANLHGSVLPLGMQDAPTMLAWSVGGTLSVRSETHNRQKSVIAGGADDFYIPRSLLADCGCQECGQVGAHE